MDPLYTSLNPNKQLKEEFVSNLTGSSMLEIAAITTVVPLFVVLRRSLFCSRPSVRDRKDIGAYVATITADFIFLVLPALLFLTVLADWVYVSAILLTILFLCVAANRSVPSSYSGGSMSLRDHISSYRVLTTIVTCLCILAVDFRIFPRRYAKTETYGTGLMDLGVGSFTLANALVSRQARNVSKVNWKAAVQATSPLLLLGFGRFFSTTSVNYQVHAGEYGVHWNFFFTLAAVSILTSVINIPPKYAGLLGLVILVGYQSWLICGLNLYLLSDKRGTDIISMNKEGIFSVVGYWGIYLVGVWLGNYLFFGNRSSAAFKSNNSAVIRVWLLALIFWLITIILDRHVERVSRRMCNLAYVTLVLADNLQVLAILMLSDVIGGSKLSALEEAFNSNLLASFLVANVLTGAVNLCLDTLFASSRSAFSVLLIYAYSLVLVAGITHHRGVRLKFW